jgi:hypothetical protein
MADAEISPEPVTDYIRSRCEQSAGSPPVHQPGTSSSRLSPISRQLATSQPHFFAFGLYFGAAGALVTFRGRF